MARNSEFETMFEGTKEFLEEFVEDSALFINRFMVGYNKDKLRNIYRGLGLNKAQVEKEVMDVNSFTEITKDLVMKLYLFYEAMNNQVPTDKELILYRGCESLEDHALDGISPTSLNKKIARNFNYGTLLKINVPVGTKVIYCSEFVEDYEEQVVLPPCDYEIVNESRQYLDGKDTRVVEVNIKPRDILKEFSIAMQRPSNDYVKEHPIKSEYVEAFELITQIIIRRALNVYPDEIFNKALANYRNTNFAEKMKCKESYGDIVLIDFLINSRDLPSLVLKQKINEKFYFVSPEEIDVIFSLVSRLKFALSDGSYQKEIK